MNKRKDKKVVSESADLANDVEFSEQDSPESGEADGGEGVEATAPTSALYEAPEQGAARLQEELDAVRDRHLRVVAEYDNFRKRTARERSEMWIRAQADVVASVLDALDDLGRVADLNVEAVSAADVVKGVELVERKLLRELEGAGLERVGETGETFDPNYHEAVGSMPAESPEDDHTVGAVLQVGYRFGGALLRPARVQVRMWPEDDTTARN